MLRAHRLLRVRVAGVSIRFQQRAGDDVRLFAIRINESLFALLSTSAISEFAEWWRVAAKVDPQGAIRSEITRTEQVYAAQIKLLEERIATISSRVESNRRQDEQLDSDNASLWQIAASLSSALEDIAWHLKQTENE